MGPPRNPVLPTEKNNSEYGFQWQTPLWLQLLFHQDADLLRPKCFVRRVLIQQASAKTQAVIRGNLDHQAGFYPKLVHIPASMLGILLSRCCSSPVSRDGAHQRWKLVWHIWELHLLPNWAPGSPSGSRWVLSVQRGCPTWLGSVSWRPSPSSLPARLAGGWEGKEWDQGLVSFSLTHIFQSFSFSREVAKDVSTREGGIRPVIYSLIWAFRKGPFSSAPALGSSWHLGVLGSRRCCYTMRGKRRMQGLLRGIPMQEGSNNGEEGVSLASSFIHTKTVSPAHSDLGLY